MAKGTGEQVLTIPIGWASGAREPGSDVPLDRPFRFGKYEVRPSGGVRLASDALQSFAGTSNVNIVIECDFLDNED